MSESDVAGLIAVGAVFLIYAAIFLVAIAICMAFMFPYYRMAKNQGMPHAWLAFIPVGNLWVMLNLPKREFNLFNKYIQTDRSKLFWHYILFCVIASVLAIPLAFIMMIPVLGWLIYIAYYVAVAVIGYGFAWRMNYDIYMTYGMEDNAMLFSILGLFVPLVTIIMSFMIMNREPNFNA